MTTRTMRVKAIQEPNKSTKIPTALQTVTTAILLLPLNAKNSYFFLSKRRTIIILSAFKLNRVGKTPSHITDKSQPQRR